MGSSKLHAAGTGSLRTSGSRPVFRSPLEQQVLLGVYVDHQIIMSKSLQQVKQVKAAMSQAFAINAGEASGVLGIETES